MDLDFALILTVAVLVAGALWALDALVLKRHRAAADKEPVVIEYAKSFFPVLFVVWALRSFLVEPFTIPSGSMLPTLQVGDYILVNKFAYGLRLPVLGTEIVPVAKPQRGDIMVFKYPEQPRINFIKRVVGVPGDRVRVQEGRVWVNGKELPHEVVSFPEGESWELYYQESSSGENASGGASGGVKHLIRHEAGRESMSPEQEWKVPADGYFMMGDNRDNSRDSRFWGFVPDRYIVGKAFFIWMHKRPGWHLPALDRNGMVI